MNDFYKNHKEAIHRGAFLILITVLVYSFFRLLFTFLAPFFFGLLLAMLAEPIVSRLVKRLKLKRWLASILTLLFFIAIISTLGAILITTLINQLSSFVTSAPYHIQELTEGLGERLSELNARLNRFEDSLPDTWQIPDIQEMLLTIVTNLFGDGMREHGVRLATFIPNLFLNTMLTLISAHFFIADRDIIWAAVKKACPKWIRAQMRQTKKGLSRAMGGYFKAQYILMLVVGIICITGLLILRSPYALFLGILLAVLDFLPILGTGAVFIPWAIVSLALGNYHQAIGLGVIYGVITITRQVLQPKILGDQMGAHPLASLMSIFIGFRIFGLLGLVIGPSLLMIFLAIYETGSGDEG